MIVLLQQIRLEWDKSSRGGQGAKDRALVPTTFQVAQPCSLPHAGTPLVYDQIRASGYDPDTAPFSKRKLYALKHDGYVVVPFRLANHAGVLDVTLESARSGLPTMAGLPSRPTRKGAKLLTLALDSWSSIVDNGRVGGFEGTHYHQDRWNIAWLSEFRGDVFTRVTPNTTLDWRSDLW